MNRSRLLLFAVGGLALGVLVGWALAPKAAPRSQSDPVQDTSADTPQQPAEPEVPAESQPVDQEGPTEATPPDAPDVAALLASLKADAYLTDGEITGGVWLQSGEPLPGVQIRATPYVAADNLPPDASLVEEVKAYAQRTLSEQAGAATAQTNAQGEYRLSGLDSRHVYRLEATLKGYHIKQVGRTGLPIDYHGPGSEVKFTALEVAWISADVRLPDGRPAESARILLSEDNQRAQASATWNWTPADPSFACRPGAWTLRARAGEYREFTGDPVSIRLVAGQEHPTLVMHLKPSPTIAGTVSVPHGQDAQTRVGVALFKQEGGEYQRLSLPRGAANDPNYFVGPLWQQKAVFRFLDLEAGNYRLDFLVDGEQVAERFVELTDGLELVHVEAPVPDASAYLVVHVTGPNGPVQERVWFSVEVRRNNGRGSSGVRPQIHGPGQYWIPRSEIRRETGATYTLEVRSTDLGTLSRNFDPDSEDVLKFEFAAPAFVNLTVVGYDDHPSRESLRALARPVDDTSDPTDSLFHRMRHDDTPQVPRRLGPLGPGEYIVELLLGTRRLPYPMQLDSRTLHLVSGDNDVELTAHRLQSLTVTIPKDYRSTQLRILNLGDPRVHEHQRTMGVAEYTFENLKPGRYELLERGSGSMRVEIPAGTSPTVVFQPQPFNGVRLVPFFGGLDQPQSPLRPGDVIEQIDGVTITRIEQFHEALVEMGDKTTSSWVVSRGGVRLTVALNSSDYKECRLRPVATRTQ